MKEITKTGLVETICRDTNIPKSLMRAIVTLVFQQIVTEVNAGHDVKIRGFGTFKWVPTEGRTRGAVVYPPGMKLRFVPSRDKLTTRR